MPIAVAGKGRKRAAVPGLFRSLVDKERQSVARIDERAARITLAGAGDDLGFYMLAVDARQRRAIMRRLEAMEAGEPQLVPVSDVHHDFPGAEGIGFLAPVDLYEVTSEEYDQTALLVRVYSNDVVEPGQTRVQGRRRSELVGQGYHHGYINDVGDWQPTALNPLTGEWRDIKPGDVVIHGGAVTQFTQAET